MKKTAVEWLVGRFHYEGFIGTYCSEEQIKSKREIMIEIIEQAKEMEKEQMKDAFVECWKSNVPDGIECKLDAEQYYNETFKSE